MHSNWKELDTIGVVEAGYLLAGLQPQEEWQSAPALVKNFYDLIRKKTGAVTLATKPGESIAITKSEFQALMDEYSVEPDIAESEVCSNREFSAAFDEFVNCDDGVNWHYWICQMPNLNATEAARLMCCLDPNFFPSLESTDGNNDLLEPFAQALMIQTLAEREEQGHATAIEWLAWADERGIEVHDGFRLAAEFVVQSPPQSVEINESIDFAMLATRQELITAFGSFTGMKASWFKNLKDRPHLLAARKVPGSGGKDSTEPLFDAHEVMQWLITKPRKGASRRALKVDTGWRLLETHFSRVYNAYSIDDPRSDWTV